MFRGSRKSRRNRREMLTSGLLAAAVMLLGIGRSHAEDTDGDFSRTTIDVGVVVNDLDAAVDFYTQALGFQQTGSFDVSAEIASASGLTDEQPLSVRVLVLGEGDSATRLKLMQVDNVESQASDNAFIHSQLGISYLTIHVADTDAALQRLAKEGISPLAEGPVSLGTGSGEERFLTLVRDPDGNLIELVGPRG